MNKQNNRIALRLKHLGKALLILFIPLSNALSAAELTLDEAVKQAVERDYWLSGSVSAEQGLRDRGEAAYQLPDPTLSLKLANLPTNTLDFNQEAMTQLVAGVSQKFPRGESRDLMRRLYNQQGDQQPLQRMEREARIRLQVTQLWLRLQLARNSEALIHRNISLFDQLEDISLASYASALGSTRQQDLVQAQLERTRIDDRLKRIQLQRDDVEQQLQGWLVSFEEAQASGHSFSFNTAETDLPFLGESLFGDELPMQSDLLAFLNRHPMIRDTEQQVRNAETRTELARQQYKPEWGLNASYGYRGDDLNNNDRADLFSIGVTVNMPLWSTARQDHQVLATQAEAEKIRTDKALKLKEMLAAVNAAYAQLNRLDEQVRLYQGRLLPQFREQAQATLQAYEADNGLFSEVVRSRIENLNARLDLLKIQTERQMRIAQLNYYFTAAGEQFPANTGVTQ